MNIDLDFDLKPVFFSENRYNNLRLLECSIYENAICIKLELLKYGNMQLLDELNFIEEFFDFYNTFISYEFCKKNMITKFQTDDDDCKYLKESNLTELFQSLYDKINLVVNELMGDIDFNPNRVTIGNKTSVFFIAYATKLKELWEKFDEKFIQNLLDKNLEDRIYRNEHFSEKLKIIPPANLKGSWARGPINF